MTSVVYPATLCVAKKKRTLPIAWRPHVCFSVPAKPSFVHLRPCQHFVMHRHETVPTWCTYSIFMATRREQRRLDIVNRLAQQHVLFVCGSPAMIMPHIFISDCVAYTVIPWWILTFSFVASPVLLFFFSLSIVMAIHVYRRLLTISYSDVLCTKHSFKPVPVCHFITFANIETSKCGQARVYQVQGIANAHCFSPC